MDWTFIEQICFLNLLFTRITVLVLIEDFIGCFLEPGAEKIIPCCKIEINIIEQIKLVPGLPPTNQLSYISQVVNDFPGTWFF